MSRKMAAAGDKPGRMWAPPTDPAVASVRQQCWVSSLPDDLLAVIYRKLASPRGRVRFAAVCRSWRATTQTAPPVAALPWLLVPPFSGASKRLHCLEDGTVVRVSLPTRGSLVGCHDGGWVITGVAAPIRIMNLFTGAELPLSEKQQRVICMSKKHDTGRPAIVWKIVFSHLPTSGDCILAAKTAYCGVALCRVGCPDGGWTIQGCRKKELDDIAFCGGQLYGLQGVGTLVKFDIGVNDHGAPVVTGEHRLVVKHSFRAGHFPEFGGRYIFDLHGKLAMALRSRWSPSLNPFFKVFEIVDIQEGGPNARYNHKWLEVTSLGDHALFLGELLSKVVHWPANTCGGGVERNCIYYSDCGSLDRQSVDPSDVAFMTFSNEGRHLTYYRKYDVADDDVRRISSVGYITEDYPIGGMWILLRDV